MEIEDDSRLEKNDKEYKKGLLNNEVNMNNE